MPVFNPVYKYLYGPRRADELECAHGAKSVPSGIVMVRMTANWRAPARGEIGLRKSDT